MTPNYPVALDEPERLAALRALDLLDTPREDRFDRITRIAQRLVHTPISLITLVDTDRQWFKSCQGLGISETPRSASFCAHAIASDEIFVVPDAQPGPPVRRQSAGHGARRTSASTPAHRCTRRPDSVSAPSA